MKKMALESNVGRPVSSVRAPYTLDQIEPVVIISYADDMTGVVRTYTVPLTQFPPWITSVLDPSEGTLGALGSRSRTISMTSADGGCDALVELARYADRPSRKTSKRREVVVGSTTGTAPGDNDNDNDSKKNDDEDDEDDDVYDMVEEERHDDVRCKAAADELMEKIKLLSDRWLTAPSVPVEVRLIICYFERA